MRPCASCGQPMVAHTKTGPPMNMHLCPIEVVRVRTCTHRGNGAETKLNVFGVDKQRVQTALAAHEALRVEEREPLEDRVAAIEKSMKARRKAAAKRKPRVNTRRAFA